MLLVESATRKTATRLRGTFTREPNWSRNKLLLILGVQVRRLGRRRKTRPFFIRDAYKSEIYGRRMRDVEELKKLAATEQLLGVNFKDKNGKLSKDENKIVTVEFHFKTSGWKSFSHSIVRKELSDLQFAVGFDPRN